MFRRLNIKKFGFTNNTLKNEFYIENTNIAETNLSSYRLIKKILAENHNFQEALEYHKCEMELLLKTTKKPLEKLLLFFNKISNNHGLIWERGILFVLVSMCFFYLIYFFSLKGNPFKIGWNGFSDFLSVLDFHLKHIFEFFLVSHKFDFMKCWNPTGLSYLIDFVSRIFIGYGIYQTIQAFRKFGKKF